VPLVHAAPGLPVPTPSGRPSHPVPTPSLPTGLPDPATMASWVTDHKDELVTKPLQILLIVVLAVVLRSFANRAISRVVDRTASTNVGERSRLRRAKSGRVLPVHPIQASARRQQRAATIGSVLRSAASFVIFGIAFVMVLGELGLNLGPIIASAGILGVALGFGAQNLVRDFLSGIFMLLEDQYGVGDVVDLGEAVGSVEAVGLRVTRVRSVDGTVWYVRNGEIARVGNQSQGWARAVLDVRVAHTADVKQVRTLLGDVASALRADEEFAELIIEDPEVWGVEAISADAVEVRLVVKTVPLEQWRVARELRERIKVAFDEAGIEIPHAQRSVWVRTSGPGADAGAPEAADAPEAPAG
jgi:moderate conductance mechanosensitive channel